MKNVFISHAQQDQGIVGELLKLLKGMGVKEKSIICASLEEGAGHTDLLGFIKKELSEETLAIFVISRAFYDNSMCQSQLGAVWAKTNNHIGMLVPPMKFENITYAFMDTQCISIMDESQLELLYKEIVKWFRLRPKDVREWERIRNRFLRGMEREIIRA